MTGCGRGCCWTAFQVCSRQRACKCHWQDRKPAKEPGDWRRHADPTAAQAIRNVMNKGRKK